jgi:hypothetical protein
VSKAFAGHGFVGGSVVTFESTTGVRVFETAAARLAGAPSPPPHL